MRMRCRIGNAGIVGIQLFDAGFGSGSCCARHQREQGNLVGRLSLGRHSREVGDVLIDLARRQTAAVSIMPARDIVAQLAREVILLDHPVRCADFAVLIALDIPSVLVELGCLSNPSEDPLLQQRAYQQKLARGLIHAVEVYFAAHAAR